MSGFKSWVQTVNDPKWYTNACVYETEAEADAAGDELASRWLAVTNNKARPTDEPVNYTFDFKAYKSRSIK